MFWKIGELLFIEFLHAGMATLGIYLEELYPYNFLFQWPVRTKIHRIYQRLLKKVNSDQKHLKWTDLWDEYFEVICTSISWEKINLKC